jgi:hypothetical protein
MKKIKKFTWITLLLGMGLLLAACGTVNIGVENTDTTLIVTEVVPGSEPDSESGVIVTPEITAEVATSETAAEVTQEPTPGVEQHQYWFQGKDPRSGVRFAIPCFWEYDIPQDDPGSLSSFNLRNYPYSFAESFPRGVGVFEAGGIKIDMIYFNYIDWGLPAGSTPRDLVLSLFDADNTETTLNSIEERVYNNQPVLRVVTESTFGTGIAYWYDLSPETVLVLGLAPMESDGLEDVQAILSSIALSPDVPVQMPLIDPALPPQGLDAECLSGIEYPVEQGQFKGTLDCATADTATIDYTACNVMDGLRSGNLSALISWMGDPFIIAYWASESVLFAPAEAIQELRQNHLPLETNMVNFTNERVKFPPLEGMPPEDMFGPDVNIAEILYSEGWGQDGLGSALLYFAQDDAGRYYWYSIVLSFGQFDK